MLQKISRLHVTIISLIITCIILGMKFLAYALTDSTALKSDALESVVNVVSAVFTLGAIVFAEKPADKDHPYGHGKIEYFSAAFEGGLISLAAILIMYEAVHAWIDGPQIKQLNVGILLNIGAGCLNGLLGIGLLKAGRHYNSKAIEADGHHVMSDFYTTLGLTIGLLFVKLTGFYWLDAFLAGAIGLILAYTGFKLVKESSNALLDQEDPKFVKFLVATMEKVRPHEVIGVHALRTMRSGRYTHIDIHVAIPEFYSVEKAHDIIDEFGKKTLELSNTVGEFHAHMDPCRRIYCKSCPIENCPIRTAPFVATHVLSVEEAVKLAPDEI